MYVCSVCGYKSIKYYGRCPECGEWNTLMEQVVKSKTKGKDLRILKLGEVDRYGGERYGTGFGDVDRVLGGGILRGSVILLGGSPGVGKSTLFLQVAKHLFKLGLKVLIISAEESILQVKHRAERLGIFSDLDITDEENLDAVLENIRSYDVVFVDSIQAVYTESVGSPAGSISQVRFCTDKIFRLAKNNDITVLIAGHITKSGVIAGPKALEHIVDVVLYLEGERTSPLRILRSEKNRFGPTNETAFLIMTDRGLKPVDEPSTYFISPSSVPQVGVAYTVITKGSLPVVLEVQSLIHPSFYPVPLRYSVGYDQKKLAIVLALIERKLGIKLSKSNIYLNISGALRSDDTFMDMAVCASIISSVRNIPLDNSGIFVGEISLTGNFKPPANVDLRESEAKRVGFKRLYSPAGKGIIEHIPVRSLTDLEGAL